MHTVVGARGTEVGGWAQGEEEVDKGDLTRQDRAGIEASSPLLPASFHSCHFVFKWRAD